MSQHQNCFLPKGLGYGSCVCVCVCVCVCFSVYVCVVISVCMHASNLGARCSSVVRAFAHGAMGCRIDPSWGGPIELFLFPASVPRLM